MSDNFNLNNVEIHWPRVSKPVKARNPNDPPYWCVQIRTTSSAQLKEWQRMGLKVKSHVPTDKDPDNYFYVNIYKKAVKDGVMKAPPDVVDARGRDFDRDIIGNGSIANLNLFSYDSPNGNKTFVLMGLQILKLVRYVGTVKKDRFDDTGEETEQIGTSGEEQFEDGEGGFEEEGFEGMEEHGDPEDAELVPEVPPKRTAPAAKPAVAAPRKMPANPATATKPSAAVPPKKPGGIPPKKAVQNVLPDDHDDDIPY